MNKFDKAILDLLQTDSTVAANDIAARVGLSATACWRRIQKLEEAGFIERRVALLNAVKLNLGVTVFVSIKTAEHSIDWLHDFHGAVAAIPEVLEVHRMAGETDYLLRVVVPDITAYDGVYKRLIQIAKLVDVSSNFSMDRIKFTTRLPLNYVG